MKNNKPYKHSIYLYQRTHQRPQHVTLKAESRLSPSELFAENSDDKTTNLTNTARSPSKNSSESCTIDSDGGVLFF